MINYYTVTNAYRDKVVKVTYDAVINEMGEKYLEYDNILYDPVKRECIKICFQWNLRNQLKKSPMYDKICALCQALFLMPETP